MHQKMCANWLCVFQINFCEATCVLTTRKGATSSDRKQKRSLIGWEWLCFWSEDSQQVNWFSVCSLQLQLREYTRKQDTAKYFHHSILKIFCFFYSLLYCKKLSCCKCLITFFFCSKPFAAVPRPSPLLSCLCWVSGQWRVFTGNELGALLGWWMFHCWKQQNSDSAAVKSLYMLSSTVSSKILRAIALKEGFHFEVKLSVFKHPLKETPVSCFAWMNWYSALFFLF